MTTIGFFGEGPVQRPKLQKPAPKKIEQWVSKVTGFSSQYDAAGWAAASVCGAPQVYPKYGDVRGAWAPQSVGKQEWIEVAFLEQVEVEKIEIYETNCPGSIIKVAGMTDAGWVDLWKGEKDLALMTSAKEARIFAIEPQIPGVVTNSLRINMSCEGAPSWCEIDCIRLTGGHNVRRVDSEPVPELDDLASDWFQLLENSERTDCILYIHQSNNPASSSEAASSSSSSSSGKKGDDQDLLNPPVSPEKPRRKGKAEVEEIAEEFRLHKVVLFQRCPVLEAKFKSTGSSVLHLTTDNPDIWVEFLAFVYTNTTEISTEKAMGLLELSIEYDLPALEDLCTNFLVKNWLHASTADAFLTYATQINAQKLLKHCQAISSSSSSS